MIILNFSHPLTEGQLAQIEGLAGQQGTVTHAVMPQFDHGMPLAGQVRPLVDAVGLTADEWQSLPIVVNLPGFAPAAACLLAEMHGRIGHFPTVVRLRPVAGSVPTIYEVGEILNLQSTRDEARRERTAPDDRTSARPPIE